MMAKPILPTRANTACIQKYKYIYIHCWSSIGSQIPYFILSGNCTPCSWYTLMLRQPHPSISYATVTLWINGQTLRHTGSFTQMLSVNRQIAWVFKLTHIPHNDHTAHDSWARVSNGSQNYHRTHNFTTRISFNISAWQPSYLYSHHLHRSLLWAALAT